MAGLCVRGNCLFFIVLDGLYGNEGSLVMTLMVHFLLNKSEVCVVVL